MRFTIAAALLFQTATTSSSFEDDNQKQVLKAVQQVRVRKRQVATAASAAVNSGRRQLKARTLHESRRDMGENVRRNQTIGGQYREVHRKKLWTPLMKNFTRVSMYTTISTYIST